MKKFVLILSVAIFILAGCASTPKRPFVEITNIPKGSGVVYLYMPKKGGKINNLEVRVDNSNGMGFYVGNIIQGTYIPFMAPVGDNLFRVGQKAINIMVEEGQTNFIWVKIVPGFFAPKLELAEVDPSAGFTHIKTTQQR